MLRTTRSLLQAAQGPPGATQAPQRTPMIKFLGKRSPPKSVDHAPHVHPASPSESLPDSFAAYRSKVQQHGPLNKPPPSASSPLAYGAIGGHAGSSLGSIQPPKGQYFDRDELPQRFRRTSWTQEEIEAVETGGASMFP